MSTNTIDPDDYVPGKFRDVANDILRAIEDAIDTDGLNAQQRAELVALRNAAMPFLGFRETVPDTIPSSWSTAEPYAIQHADREARWAEQKAQKVAAIKRWQAMNREQRDALILDEIGEGEMTVSELFFALASSSDQTGVIFSNEKVRAQLKSMADRGVVAPVEVTREKTGTRPITAWVVVDAQGNAARPELTNREAGR